MPLAAKDNSLIVKDGKVAENCDCCGEWYCYCRKAECGLFDGLGLTSKSMATVTIAGVESADKSPNLGFWYRQKKPGEALNTTVCVRQAPRPWWGEDGRGYGSTTDLWMENVGASFVDRTAPYASIVVTELRVARTIGTGGLMVGIVQPPAASNTSPIPAWGVKEVDPCALASGESFSVTFKASEGDFGSLSSYWFPGAALPENKLMKRIYGGFAGSLGANTAEYNWSYSLRNAEITVTFGEDECEPPDDAKAWWFATPFGGSGSENKPPESITLTIDNPTSSFAERFAGEYTLELGKNVFGVDAGGGVLTQQGHGSYYAGFADKGMQPWGYGSTVRKHVFIGAVPTLIFVNQVPSIIWRISLNEQPKMYGWYGGDGFCNTDPVPYGENTSGTLTGHGQMAQYPGGGEFDVTLEL